MRNTEHGYGLVSRSLHWLIALAVTGLFGIGLYMVELTYYDPAYTTLPHWHKSVGMLVAILMALRVVWRLASLIPAALPGGKAWEHKAASLAHFFLYALPFAVLISGYLISTADGRPIQVFDWFAVPALLPPIKGMETPAGLVHQIMAWSMAGLVVLHSLAALKHHFIDKNRTLIRMIKSTS